MSKIKWNLDPSHSEVTFKVKHMMITNVSGSFTEFAMEAETEGEDFTKSDVTFTAKAASVNTNAEQRDTHLRSAEFFDSDKFPEIKFKATKYEKVAGDDYKLHGDLTIKDVTKTITLDVEYGGIQKDPWGNMKAGFTVNGKINRKDFGLTWNATLETGGVMVSEEVKINCEIQLVKA
jgi:polyisoprenoid-binding protein YceI